MRFKIDENLPQAAAHLLQAAGFEAQTVRDEALEGSSDDVIADAVRTEARVLLTLDRVAGQAAGQGRGSITAGTTDAVFATEQLAGAHWIVEPDRIRVHRT